jgi:hypothetical protein
MRTLAVLSLGVFLGLGLALNVSAQEEATAKAVIEKAIKAHGGAKNLAKQKAIIVKATGSLDSKNLKITSESFFQDPDKFKNVVEVEVNNMNVTVTVVFNGKRFWINALGKTTELKDKKDIAELKESLYIERLTNLVGLKAKGISLSPLGDVRVKDKEAVGIRVSSKGHRDINLFFDKKTHMLVKSEARIVDLETKKEVNQEKFYSDYKEVGGIQQPRKIIIHQDGKPHITMDVTSITFVERHEDSVFAEP